MRMTLRTFRAMLCCGALTLPAIVSAQATSPQVPTREEVLRGEVDDQLREDAAAFDLEGAFERAPCPLSGAQFADITLTLASARFAGTEALEPGLLDAAWRPYVGREIALAAICDIRDRAATILRSQGYVAAVQVPVQTIENGQVEFNVVLARLTDLVVRGDTGPSGRLVERYFDRMRGQDVFRIGEAERLLLLARDIPGLDVRLMLARDPAADARAGDLVGVIDVINTPIEADLAVQNYGTKAVGRFGGQARIQFNGLTGLGDLTEISGFATADFQEQYVIQGQHEFALGGDGLRVGAAVTHAWTRPDVPGDDVFDARTLVASAYVSYPLQRSQAQNVYLSGGFEFIDQDIEFSGLPLGEDKLRVGYIAADLDARDPMSVAGRGGYSAVEPRYAARAHLEVRQGLDILGASDGCGELFVNCTGVTTAPITRLDGDPTAFVVRGDASFDYRPSRLVTFSLRPRFQYSPDAVLPYEQFSGGNYTAGRGYDPGAVVGDRGFGSQFEIAYGSLLPETQDGFALQPFAFYDNFNAWTENDGLGEQTLNSLGAGLRVNYQRRIFFEILGAIPLERTSLQTERGDARVLVNLAIRLGD